MLRDGLVVICIPSYNQPDKLIRLLNSIEEQDYDEVVTLVSDDSTNDYIQSAIRERVGKKLIYERNPSPIGATKNTNRLINRALELIPRYIKIMHQDDYFVSSQSLSKMVRDMDDQPEATILFSSVLQENDLNTRQFFRANDSELDNLKSDWRYIYKGNFLYGPSNTLIRNTGEDIYLDSNLLFLIDVELYMRILKRKAVFLYENDALVVNEIGDYQLSDKCAGTPHLISDEIIYIYSKYPELHKKKYIEWAIYKICVYEMRWHKNIEDLRRYICEYSREGKELLEKILKRIEVIRAKKLHRIVIYGVGTMFKDHMDRILELNSYGRITTLCDRNKKNIGKYTINTPEMIVDSDYDSVIITSPKYYDEILKELCNEFGVIKERVLPKETIYFLHLI